MVIGATPQEGGDLGHGELAGVVHPLGFADEAGGHFGFASALVTPAAGGDEAGLGGLLDESGFVFGHQGEHAEDEFAVGGGEVSTMPLVNDCTPTPRHSRVVMMSIRSRRFRPSRSIFQMTRVSPVRRSSRQRIHCGRAALVGYRPWWPLSNVFRSPPFVGRSDVVLDCFEQHPQAAAGEASVDGLGCQRVTDLLVAGPVGAFRCQPGQVGPHTVR
jgi:hypothetical protein